MTRREIEPMVRLFFMLFLLPSLVSETYAADTAIIKIEGQMKDNACSISLESQNFAVDLLSTASKQFYTEKTTSISIPFKVVFDKCGSSAIAVKIGYSGVSDNDDATLLKIAGGANAASGVGVQILNHDQAEIALNTGSGSLEWTPLIANERNTVAFYARLKATRSPVRAGLVNATASITLEFQ